MKNSRRRQQEKLDRPKNIKAKKSQLEIEVLASDNRGWPRRELYKN